MTAPITLAKERQVVIIVLKAERSHSEISLFLNVARSFVIKIPKDLEVTYGSSTAVSKRLLRILISSEYPNI